MSETNYCSWCGGKIGGRTYYAKDKHGHLYHFGSKKCRDSWEQMKSAAEGKVCVD